MRNTRSWKSLLFDHHFDRRLHNILSVFSWETLHCMVSDLNF